VNYNYNFIENEYYLPARIIPRFSSLPRSMSMLANRSRSDTSSDNEEECNSLADSLEDLTRYLHQHFHTLIPKIKMSAFKIRKKTKK